jgi:hypothetical protein
MRNGLRYNIDLHQVERQGWNVCLGSEADLAPATSYVRFVPTTEVGRDCSERSVRAQLFEALLDHFPIT